VLRWPPVALAIGCAGCVPVEPQGLTPPPGAQTAVLLSSGLQPSLLAIDLGQRSAVLSQDARAVAYYRSSIPELGLAPPIVLVPEGRPLPHWQSFEALIGSRDQAETDLSQLTLAPIDWNAVLEAGGCAKRSVDGPDYVIDLSCPSRVIDPAKDALLPAIGPAPTCPEGWVKDDVDLLLAMPRAGPEEGPHVVVDTCDPATEEHEGTEISCPAGELRPPSAPSCAPIGHDCNGGAWPSALDPAHTLYVDLAAPAGGTGAIDQPLSSLTQALNLASGTTTIALSAGRYAGDHLLPSGVRIIGRCPTLTSFSGALGIGGDAQLDNLALGGPLRVAAGAKLSANAVALGALSVETGGVVQLRRAVVTGTVAIHGARIEVDGAMLSAPIALDQESRVSLSSVYSTGSARFIVAGGSTLSVQRSHVFGAFSVREGQLTLRDVVIDGPAVIDPCVGAQAAKICSRQSSLDLSRLRILRLRDEVRSSPTAIMVRGVTAERHVKLTDVVVLTPHHRVPGVELPFEATLGGPAVLDAHHEDADNGGMITLERVLFDVGPGAGLRLYRSQSQLNDVHLIAIDGVGLAQSNGFVSAHRLSIAGCRDGIDVGEPASNFHGEDIQVHHSYEPITVHNSTLFRGDRFQLSAQTGPELRIGRLPSENGVLDAATVKIHHIRTLRPLGPGFGVDPGVLVAFNATVEITDFELTNEAGAALQFSGAAASMRLTLKRGVARGQTGIWWDDKDAPRTAEAELFDGVRSAGERAFRHQRADQR